MGPKAILKDAYLHDLMPTHLYGSTQHKTLQARLSEDILQSKERSRFVRTEPGKFFLRELLTDETIPSELRKTITARRRKRELSPDPVLCVAKDSVTKLSRAVRNRQLSIFGDLLENGELSYFKIKQTPEDHLPLWCFAILARNDEVLTYRIGRYRISDADINTRRTIGFTSLVTEDQQTLFNQRTLGILESGVSALVLDLDFPLGVETLEHDTNGDISIVTVGSGEEIEAVLAVFETHCPTWFEPTSRRLSMNDMKWMQFRVPPNHLDDFDTWSQAVVRQRFAYDE